MLHHQIHKKQIRKPVSKVLQNPVNQAEIMCINEKAGEEANTKGVYSEIKEQKSMKASQAESNDSMYNHLNETETVDRGEYYDHARPGHSVSTPSDGCGTVTVDYDHARPSHSVSTLADGYGTVTVEYSGNDKCPEDEKSMIYNDKLGEKAKADEYFVLEKIQ
ncbi:uncharacterized protein LOC133187916 [Saccostrea echinata]|uniref:uncharacterized protein LOC133187916 n=1 Tax=Saccostrea echinata TaxID=191078 RepID=UPI002A802F08|nr:uncharacterized protein LOC133187916 [Saccostrea echinata]